MVSTAHQLIEDDAHSANNPRAECTESKVLRLQQVFWLNTSKPDERWLSRKIKALKAERQYSRAVRDGLRLFLDLRDGRIDVLLELFPFVKDRLQQAGQGDLEARLAALEHQLRMTAPAPTNIVPMTPVLKPVAQDDDGGLLVVKKAASDGQSAQNFLDAAFGLVQ